MPARGRHQSTSKECRKRIQQIEALDDVIGVIIGHSCGGKSLGKQSRTAPSVYSASNPATQGRPIRKGLQELFIRTTAGQAEAVAGKSKTWLATPMSGRSRLPNK